MGVSCRSSLRRLVDFQGLERQEAPKGKRTMNHGFTLDNFSSGPRGRVGVLGPRLVPDSAPSGSISFI